MDKNPVREKLNRGEASVGTWCVSADPTVVEVLARSGLDWITIDFEHNAIDVSTAVNCLRAAQGTNVPLFARVPSNDPVWIKRVLDIGFLGVVIPDVRTPEEAERAVKASRYRPDGVRGIGSTRGSLIYGSDYYAKANDLVMVVVMIEDRGAVEIADQIISVPGVDIAFIGPNDLASSLGVPVGLDNKHPDHIAAVEKVLAAGKKAGVPVGIHCTGGAEISRRIAQGFQWMPIGSDARVIKTAFEAELRTAYSGSNGASPDANQEGAKTFY